MLKECLPHIGNSEYALYQRSGLGHDALAQLTELMIEPKTETWAWPQPLYSELLQTRGIGDTFWEACARLAVSPERNEATLRFAEGPLPKPDSIVVTSWKWVWRGLDPETRFR